MTLLSNASKSIGKGKSIIPNNSGNKPESNLHNSATHNPTNGVTLPTLTYMCMSRLPRPCRRRTPKTTMLHPRAWTWSASFQNLLANDRDTLVLPLLGFMDSFHDFSVLSWNIRGSWPRKPCVMFVK